MARIYVSSTFTDLKEVRDQVRLTLRRLGHEDVAMEYYVAEGQRPLERCLADVESCDLYLGIFAWRYGFIPPGYDKSITELEYRLAREKGKKCLAFLLHEEAPWPMDRLEKGALDRIEALRKELAQEHLSGYFTSKDDIGARVAEAISNWEKSTGRDSKNRLTVWLESYALELEEEYTRLLHRDGRPGQEEAAGGYIDTLITERPHDKEKWVAPEPFPLSRVAGQPGIRVIVLGGGGAGKTTMLRRLAFDCARRALTQPDAPVPIYVRLNFFDAQSQEFENLLGIAARGAGLDRAEMFDLWQKGSRSCLFLLDGLNEVRRDYQDGCRLALQQFTQRKAHSYVMTSRPGAQPEELARQIEGCLVTEVVGLDPGQIKGFLAAYGLAELFDRMDERLRSLTQNPFMLWAIAQSCAGLQKQQLPANVGQLYKNLIDNYIFGVREKAKPKESRPTNYNYELVKKPVLARLAIQMCRQGTTRLSEDRPLLIDIRDQLREIRAAHEGILPVEPHTLMPDPPVASSLLDEIVENGVLYRVGGTLEFMHESVRDFFAATGMSHWSTEEILDAVPALVWRHIEPKSDDLALEAPFATAIVMLSGLLADSSDLLCRLIGRHPLLAAQCFAGAGSLRPDVEAELIKQWAALLDRYQPRYRWVGCQCLRMAGVASPDVARRLGKLIRNDKNVYVPDVAARALAGLKHSETIVDLVEEALNAESKSDNVDLGRVFADLPSEIAVLRLFNTWRDPHQPEARKRRAERLMATIDPKIVRQVLHEAATQARDHGHDALTESAHSALSQLDSWNAIGIKGLFRVSDKLDLDLNKWAETRRAIREQMDGWPAEQLIAALSDIEVDKRITAARYIGAQQADAVAPLLEALAREKYDHAREAFLEALGRLEQKEELLRHWRARILDDRWTFLFSSEPGLKEALEAGALTESWRGEFEKRRLRFEDHSVIEQVHTGWLITFDYWPGWPAYLVKSGADALNVFDASLRLRLMAVAKLLGTGAIPVIREALVEKDPLLEMAAIEVLGEIGGIEAVEMLREFLLRNEQPQIVEAAIRALGGTRSQSAIPLLIESLKSLQLPPASPEDPTRTPASLADLEDWQVEPLRNQITLIIAAFWRLQARGVFIDLGRETFASGDNVSRFVVAAGLSVWPDFDQEIESLLTRAVTDENLKIRLEAVKGLAAAKTEVSEKALLETCLNDPHPEARYRAAVALRWFTGDGAIQYLIRALREVDIERRSRAVEALGLLQDEAAIPYLLEIFESGPSRLWTAAAGSLLACGYEKFDTLLEKLIPIVRQDSDETIRKIAFDALRKLPEGEERLYLPIKEALSQKRFEEVIEMIGREAPFLPNNANLYWWRGYARAALKRPGEALNDFDQVITLFPNSAVCYSLRSVVLGELGRWEEALMAARETVRLEEGNANYQTDLGWYAYRAAHLQESIAASRRALELDPKLLTAEFNLGLALLADGQWKEAEDVYRRGIENSKEIEETSARSELDAALADLKELLKAHEEYAIPVGQVEGLLEQARADRSG
jgi:HEAT repeat protein